MNRPNYQPLVGHFSRRHFPSRTFPPLIQTINLTLTLTLTLILTLLTLTLLTPLLTLTLTEQGSGEMSAGGIVQGTVRFPLARVLSC